MPPVFQIKFSWIILSFRLFSASLRSPKPAVVVVHHHLCRFPAGIVGQIVPFHSYFSPVRQNGEQTLCLPPGLLCFTKTKTKSKTSGEKTM